MYMVASAFLWKSEDNLQEAVLSYHHVDPEIKLRSSGTVSSGGILLG